MGAEVEGTSRIFTLGEQQNSVHWLPPDVMSQASKSTTGQWRQGFAALNFQSQLDGVPMKRNRYGNMYMPWGLKV